MMDSQHLRKFLAFITDDIKPATEELTKIKDNKSRVHIQKLIYTNLVDRFDYCIDRTLLDILEISEDFKEEILEKHNNPIIEKDMLRIFISEDPTEYVNKLLQDKLRATEFKKRHSLKLQKLIKVINLKESEFKNPRVNPSTGKISSSYKQQNIQIPASILGYADWLYSRRNAVVHGGGGTKMLKTDLRQLAKIYNVSPATTCRLSLPSIKSATVYYEDLVTKYLIIAIQKLHRLSEENDYCRLTFDIPSTDYSTLKNDKK